MSKRADVRTNANRSTSLWERLVAVSAAALVVVVVLVLAIRNQPIVDKNVVVLLRIVISIAIAIFGATVPGFLDVSWHGSGLGIRAGGALALFVLTIMWTPVVLNNDVGPSPVISTNPPVVAETGTIFLGQHVTLTVADVPNNAELIWEKPEVGRLSTYQGNPVIYTAPNVAQQGKEGVVLKATIRRGSEEQLLTLNLTIQGALDTIK